jgi:hypothetical protein
MYVPVPYWTLLGPYTLQVSEIGSYIMSSLSRNKPTLNNELPAAEPKS